MRLKCRWFREPTSRLGESLVKTLSALQIITVDLLPLLSSDQLLALGAWRVLRPFCPHRVREGLRFGRRLNGLRWSARIIVRRCSVLRWPFAPPNPFPVIGTVLFPVSPPGSGQGSSIFIRVRTGYR